MRLSNIWERKVGGGVDTGFQARLRQNQAADDRLRTKHQAKKEHQQQERDDRRKETHQHQMDLEKRQHDDAKTNLLQRAERRATRQAKIATGTAHDVLGKVQGYRTPVIK